jgi:pumilio RNA-binding family
MGAEESLHYQSTTPLMRSNNSDSVDRYFSDSLLLGDSGLVTAPPISQQQHSFNALRPPSVGELNDDTSSGGRAVGRHRQFVGSQARGDQLVGFNRSRSASLHDLTIRPPPGLATGVLHGTSMDTLRRQTAAAGIRRAATTGFLGSMPQAAVRPSAKTLMDFIQEDFPERVYDSTANGIDRRSASPAIRPSGEYGGFAAHFRMDLENSQRQQMTDQHHQSYFAENGQEAGSYQRSLVSANLLQQGGNLQQQRFSGDLGRLQSTEDHRSSYVHVQPYNLNQQQSSHYQHGAHQQPVAYKQYEGHQQQHLYGDSGPSQQHRVDVHQNSQQMISRHAVQPGQTVYVNSPTAHPGQYGYTTLQYHAPNGQSQPTQVIHHQSMQHRKMQSSVHNDQYIAVVSIPQGGGQQPPIYWEADQQLGMGQSVALLHPSSSSSVAVNRISQASQGRGYGNSNYGRGGRGGDKGGRGKRGARRGDPNIPTMVANSPVLEEFRTAKVRDWTMYQIEGHVVEFCQDQNGSRFIQQRLELGDTREQQIVMTEVLPAIRRLRNDVFGNYVVQKLLDFGTPDMKAEIWQTLHGEIMELSMQIYGCRVVQKAFETLDDDGISLMLKEFQYSVLSCIHDQNGNHVIQKCIEVLNTRAKQADDYGNHRRAAYLRDEIAFVVDDVVANIVTLSCHPYGCRVLQRILEHCSEESRVTVLDEIKKYHQKLLDDQYGNYVIQHVLQFGRPLDRDSILGIVVDNGLLGLSRQKFASNVVEKLLKYGNGAQRRAIAQEMLKVRTALYPWCRCS